MTKPLTIIAAITVKKLSFAAVMDNDNWPLYSPRARAYSFSNFSSPRCSSAPPRLSVVPLLLGFFINIFGLCDFNQVYSDHGRLFILFEVVL